MAASQHLPFSSLLFLFVFCVLIVEVWGANLELLGYCANPVPSAHFFAFISSQGLPKLPRLAFELTQKPRH